MATQTLTDRIRQAEAHITDGDYGDALTLLHEVLSEDATNTDALNDAAIAYKEMGDVLEAVKCLEAVLQQDPTHSNAFFNLLDTLAITDDLELVIDAYLRYEGQIPDTEEKVRYAEGINAAGASFFSEAPLTETEILPGINLQRLIDSKYAYQPISVGNQVLKKGKRDCADRWSLMKRVIESKKVDTVLDLGCAEGYFVKKAAAMGCTATGVDNDPVRIATAFLTTLHEKLPHCYFSGADINEAFIHTLQPHDLVICTSLLHHFLYRTGLENTQRVLNAIHGITQKALIFETGQSDEQEMSWATQLPDMGSDPLVWIEGFLSGAGFTNVEVLGQTDSFNSEVARYLLVATPKSR